MPKWAGVPVTSLALLSVLASNTRLEAVCRLFQNPPQLLNNASRRGVRRGPPIVKGRSSLANNVLVEDAVRPQHLKPDSTSGPRPRADKLASMRISAAFEHMRDEGILAPKRDKEARFS